MADWYLAPALAVLRSEINDRWPGRDRTSDGTIGDSAHQTTRSDHNPNDRGSVNAIDIDEDGVDMGAIFAAARRHPSARYWIYERKLYHRLRGWKPEPYDGPNPHDKHGHLSIDQTEQAEQDRRPWGLLEDEMAGGTADKILEGVDLLLKRQSDHHRQDQGERPRSTGDTYGWIQLRATLSSILAAVQGADATVILDRIEQLAADVEAGQQQLRDLLAEEVAPALVEELRAELDGIEDARLSAAVEAGIQRVAARIASGEHV